MKTDAFTAQLPRRVVNQLVLADLEGHHIALLGPPGVGKTMIARRIGGEGKPFRAPHHTVSFQGLVGGRTPSGVIDLGEVGRASGGVLYLDDAPEFSQRSLEAVADVVKTGVVHRGIGGVGYRIRLPWPIRLVIAANPCPCGYRGLNRPAYPCHCSDEMVARYMARMAPVLERCESHLYLGETR